MKDNRKSAAPQGGGRGGISKSAKADIVKLRKMILELQQAGDVAGVKTFTGIARKLQGKNK